MNPFLHHPTSILGSVRSFSENYPKPYCKQEVDPYTRTRVILMNGTEFEANWFSHQMSRHISNNELRRELALTRFVEKQQQLRISLLKPCDETQLEHTIGYEQLAVDLTAELAKRETDCYVKKALDFALLEDFDHLYRYANQLEMEKGVLAERLVGRYTEIMPGRPTVAHHRHPFDNVKRHINSKTADKQTVLNTMIITAAEQQTMNFYMNISALATNDSARRLYEEIALVEEEHVTQYGSLVDTNGSWLEMLLWHEYCECYLYWSCYMTESDSRIKCIWEENLEMEIAHLHKAAELLKKYEGKEWQEVISDGSFPSPISLHENICYVREILASTVQFTGCREEYKRLEHLPSNFDFFSYQQIILPTPGEVPSHCVIDRHIKRYGKDYRYERKENPIKELRCRTKDNVEVGREPRAAESTDFFCNE